MERCAMILDYVTIEILKMQTFDVETLAAFIVTVNEQMHEMKHMGLECFCNLTHVN